MDLVNPASLHFSRAWGRRGGEQPLGTGNITKIHAEKINKHGHIQELTLSIKRKKQKKVNTYIEELPFPP